MFHKPTTVATVTEPALAPMQPLTCSCCCRRRTSGGARRAISRVKKLKAWPSVASRPVRPTLGRGRLGGDRGGGVHYNGKNNSRGSTQSGNNGGYYIGMSARRTPRAPPGTQGRPGPPPLERRRRARRGAATARAQGALVCASPCHAAHGKGGGMVVGMQLRGRHCRQVQCRHALRQLLRNPPPHDLDSPPRTALKRPCRVGSHHKSLHGSPPTQRAPPPPPPTHTHTRPPPHHPPHLWMYCSRLGGKS